MGVLIRMESKRIIKTGMLVLFYISVFVLSINSSYQAVKNYEIWDTNNAVVSGMENLKHGKEQAYNKEIIKILLLIGQSKINTVFVETANVEKLVNLNYAGKNAKDLSNTEISQFYENRLSVIEQSIDESSFFRYTEKEKEHFMMEAGKLTSLTVGFSEGWKVLNRDLGNFIPFVLILISLLIMPLFAEDSQTKMKELSRCTKKGKTQLDFAKLMTAFGLGSIFYWSALLAFFFIKMIPFGFTGGTEFIQSNADTIFSVYHINYLEQFLWNSIRGYVSLLFIVSLTTLTSIMLKRILVGIVAMCFYWILLLIMEQMMQYEVNHWFANFMPLRLAGSRSFYITNEIYRVAGKSFDSILWCPVVTMIISIVIVIITIIWLKKRSERISC